MDWLTKMVWPEAQRSLMLLFPLGAMVQYLRIQSALCFLEDTTPADDENHPKGQTVPDPRLLYLTMVQRWYMRSVETVLAILNLDLAPGLATWGPSPLRCQAVSEPRLPGSQRSRTDNPPADTHSAPTAHAVLCFQDSPGCISLTLAIVNTLLSNGLCARGFCPPGGRCECGGHVEGWPG